MGPNAIAIIELIGAGIELVQKAMAAGRDVTPEEWAAHVHKMDIADAALAKARRDNPPKETDE
jgi:hypothetical protein